MKNIYYKLVYYINLKYEHTKKRVQFLRKPVVYITHPRTFINRKITSKSNLSEIENSKYNELNDYGYCEISELAEKNELKNIQSLINGRINGISDAFTEQISKRKGFWLPILANEDMNADSDLVKFVLNDKVIEIVSKYLGQIPYLSRLELVVSKPNKDSAWSVSQLWHRDYNDSKIVKYFTYLSDVDTVEQGPFTFLPMNISRNIRISMFPVHKTDNFMSKYVDLNHKKQVLGKSGTSFLIDTRNCFHCGSRILDGSFRVALIATFTTFATYYPYNNGIESDKNTNPKYSMLLNCYV